MIRHSLKSSGVLVCGLLLVAASSFAQNWPKPATTPNTTVKCDATIYAGCANADGKLIAGWDLPVKAYVGRVIDSGNVFPVQYGFRTARGYLFRVTPTRIYENTGSTVLAWNRSTFFTRLPIEPLVAGTSFPASRNGAPEYLLHWDGYFCAEAFSNWLTPVADGDQRLYDIDSDDRGYVYVAYSIFGWGIVKDTGSGAFDNGIQKTPIANAQTILSVKSQNKYYAVVSDPGSAEVWYAGNASGLPTQSQFTKVASINGVIHRWAKSADGTRIAVITDTGLQIYTADGIVSGAAPIATATAPSGAITSVDSDGTNFFARWDHFYAKSGVIIMKPNGSTYSETDYDLPLVAAQGSARPSIRVGANLLVVAGGEITPALGGGRTFYNIRIFKLNNLVPTEIKARDNSTFRFFAQYYGANGALDGYGAWNSAINDAVPVQEGNKTYLLVAAFGLADVFELQTSDSITASVTSTHGTANANSAALSGAGPFIGDRITFHSETSTGVQPQVNWDFGDGQVGSTPAGTYDITHQYAGAGSFSATALDTADTSLASSASVTVKTPQVAFGILGRTDLLFTQPNASSPAPILTSDSFTDASDGGIDSHYADWIFTGGPTVQTTPSATVPAGACGPHTLVFAAHYGPYVAGALPPASATSPYAISGFVYNARPFAPMISGPASSPISGKVRFTSTPRLTTTTADLPNGANTQVKYTWTASNGEPPLTGTSTLGAVPPFDVTKPSTGTLSVDLSIEVTDGSLPAACLPLTKQIAQTLGPLAAPSGTLQQSGCTSLGAPCSFSVSTAANTTGWTYSWSVNPTAGITPQGSSATLSTSGMQANTQYRVSVTVDNTIGAVTLTSAPFTLTAPSCPTMTSANVGINYSGTSIGSGCYSGGQCNVGENIQFSATQFGYNFSCAPHTFTWDFGDNSTPQTVSVAAPGPTHSFSSAKAYTITLTLDNGNQVFHATTTLNISGGGGGNPGGPGPTGCGTMTTTNIGIGYLGTSLGCYPSGQCGVGEELTFSATQFGYNFSCGAHTFVWDFGDGSAQATVNSAAPGPKHAYGAAGNYNVTVTISSPSQSNFQITSKVTIGTPTPTNSCGTMSDSNVFVNYTGAKTQCVAGRQCNTDEDVDFYPTAGGGGLAGSTPYSFSCASHTFTWNFGDAASGALNTATVTDADTHVHHTFTSAGTYTVAVEVYNGVQRFTAHQTVTVAAANAFQDAPCGPTTICVNNAANARYSVSLSAKDTTGAVVQGTAVTQKGPFGFFSFPELTGDKNNPEVFVKVLELTAGKPWVFYAGLTNLDYTITVQDQLSNLQKSYHVAPPAAGSLQSFGDFDVDGKHSADVYGPASCLPVNVEQTFVLQPPSCATDSSGLCLLNRFRVTLEAADLARTLHTGAGLALPVNSVFGLFSTPTLADPSDVQAFIKMVDARSFDGHFWVFLGGLTDMQLKITVTDTLTGAQNVYTKPVSSTCGWNDVDAFR